MRWFGTNTDIEAERAARAAAEAANQAKMDFLATMSHELRTRSTRSPGTPSCFRSASTVR